MTRSPPIVREQPREMPSEQGPLAPYKGSVPPAPDWFQNAIAQPCEHASVGVAGARVTYQLWGKAHDAAGHLKQGLLFVHGNGAHAHWWDFIAPFFVDDYRVAALTFTGMGDSDRRERYDMATFAEEEMAVCEHAGFFAADRAPIIVAHSFGGFVTILAGAVYGERLAGEIIVDSPVNPPERKWSGPPRTARPNKVYPTLEAALARFRLAPQQRCDNHFILDYIARHSLARTPIEGSHDCGWHWKFDPLIWNHFDVRRDPAELLRETKCRIAIIRGAESVLMPDDVRDYMSQLLNRSAPFVSIPEARHHVLLDQPIAFISALRALLADWDHSEDRRQRA